MFLKATTRMVIQLSEFRATVFLIQEAIKDKEGKNRSISGVSTNMRNLEVIKIFEKGDCKVSSVSEVPKLRSGGGNAFAFKVDFNTVHNEDVQSIIEKFNEVFVVKSISEVGKN